MTGSEVPRSVRTAVLLAWLMVPAGALLVVAGVVDLVWWASPDAQRTTALMAAIEAEYGTIPPAMLRAGAGAAVLVVMGAAGLAYAVLAPLIARGDRWARSSGIGAATGIFLVGLMTVGADASQPIYLRDYYSTLTLSTIGDRIPPIEAVIYPSWFPWLEDVAQGVGTILALGVAVALIWTAVVNAEYFMARGAGTGTDEPDEWDTAISRMRANKRPEDQA